MKPSPEITDLMRSFYGRMQAGDAEGANSLISIDPSMLFIGSAGEWVDDQDALRSGRLDPGEGLVEGPDPVAWEEGDVGWFADKPEWVFGDGSRAEMRYSVVLRREPEGWRIVHTHLSSAVPDDQCVTLQRRWKHGIKFDLDSATTPTA